MRATILIAAISLLIASSATAEDVKPPSADLKFGAFTGEVVSTDAPAFAALGLDGKEVVSPEQLKAAALSFLQGVDGDGKYKTGAAVQFSPAVLLFPQVVAFNKYRSSWGVRALANFELTAAVATGSTAENPGKAALGFVWKPYDTRDPFANKALNACIDQADKAHPVAQPSGPPEVGKDTGVRTFENKWGVDDPGYIAAAEACRKSFVISDTQAVAFQFGFAKTFSSTTGRFGNFTGRGYAASAVVLIGLGPRQVDPSATSGKLLLGTLYRRSETVTITGEAGSFVDRNRWAIGGRALYGKATRWMLGVEVLHQEATYSDLGRDNYLTYRVSFDYKIADKLWLTTSYGDASGSNFGKSAQFVSGLRLAFGPDTTIGSH